MVMDFREATDELLAGISHKKLAQWLGVKIPSVRQARLDPSAKAYRKPQEGWEQAVGDLAQTEGYRLLQLAKTLQKAAKTRK